MREKLLHWLQGFFVGIIISSLLAFILISAETKRFEHSQDESRREVIMLTQAIISITNIIQNYDLALRWNKEAIAKPEIEITEQSKDSGDRQKEEK